MEPAEEAARTTHVVADALGGSLLKRVESGDALKSAYFPLGSYF